MATTAAIYTWSTSGRSSRSTLTAIKWSLRTFAISWFSKDSCAMTWHQWQVEYPMDKRMGLSAPTAAAKACGPQGYQNTGLLECWSRYGLCSATSRLTDIGFEMVQGVFDSFIAGYALEGWLRNSDGNVFLWFY